MSSKGHGPKKVMPYNKNAKKSTDKSSIRSVITTEQELRELKACRARISTELKLFSALNKPAAIKNLESKFEPKIVKLDTEFASKSRTNKNSSASDLQVDPMSLDNMAVDTLRQFNQLPISTRTKKALADEGYKMCTRIQHASLSSSLALKDLYAISCTGSGKSLAFIIPVLEHLWKLRWGPELGLGALIIEPTRELALQTFHALHRIGKYHPFSAGLLVGGNSYEEERKLIAEMNILVCTPGRLIHHIEKSFGLTFDNLVALVIDEADHLLDTGFADQFEQIQPLFPKDKTLHTMLFSATTNPQVEKFASKVLSKNLHFITLSSQASPANLQHRFIVTPEVDKVRALFEFIRLHKSNKIVVFAATTREVSYLYELFKVLNIQAPLHRLHSKLSHGARMNEYYQYQQEKFGTVICTDIASRGLDFTDVSWVVHFDCPTSVPQYTHRAGRTARLKGNGTNLLLLTPSQEQFISLLTSSLNNFEIKQVGLPPFKADFFGKLQAQYSEHPLLKAVAEKAIISYMQHLMHEFSTFTTLFKAREDGKEGEFKKMAQEFSSTSRYAGLVRDTNSRFYNCFLAHLFDMERIDMIGLCRAFGLHSVPVMINEDDEAALEAEQAELEAQLKKKREEKAMQKTKGKEKEEEEDAQLALLKRTNPELDEFSNRLMFTQIAEKRLQETIQAQAERRAYKKDKAVEAPQQDGSLASFGQLFSEAKKQPTAPQQVVHAARSATEFVCEELSSDDEDSDDAAVDQATLLAKLKARYSQRDIDDKKQATEKAQQKRRTRQNFQLLERFARLGYKMSLEDLEDMIQQKKDGKKVDLEQFKGGLEISGEMSDFDSDVDFDNQQTAQDVISAYALGEDDSDDFSDDFSSAKTGNKVVQLGKPGQHTLFADDSDDDEEATGTIKFGLNEDTDDDSEDDFVKPLPQQLNKGKVIKPAAPTPALAAKMKANASMLDETSDDDSDDDVSNFAQKAKIAAPATKTTAVAAKKPAAKAKPTTAAKAFSLDESSDSDSDGAQSDDDIASRKKVTTAQPKRFLNLDESSDDSDSDDDKPVVQVTKKVAVAAGKGRKVVAKK